jgi:putative transposase
MLTLIRLCLGTIARLFCARRSLLLENLALRQQLTVFKRRHPRPRLTLVDKLFWVTARRVCKDSKQILIIVLPETVVRWYQAGFQLYWRLISRFRGQVGRRRILREIRDLIFRMVDEYPTWGEPRIHGELLMLGFDVSERTISRCMRKAPRDPELAKRWLAFLHNHREAIAAMDFFTVPALTFGVLYCFLVIGHDRRKVLHLNVTKHPTSMRIVQQLRQAFPFDSSPRFLIYDRDAKYGSEFPSAIRSMKIDLVQTSYQSPWQNGVEERWVESCRRDLLDHVIALDETHLRRLISDSVRYYNEDRTHPGLEKETSGGRIRSGGPGSVLSHERLGGSHHRYERAA